MALFITELRGLYNRTFRVAAPWQRSLALPCLLYSLSHSGQAGRSRWRLTDISLGVSAPTNHALVRSGAVLSQVLKAVQRIPWPTKGRDCTVCHGAASLWRLILCVSNELVLARRCPMRPLGTFSIRGRCDLQSPGSFKNQQK